MLADRDDLDKLIAVGCCCEGCDCKWEPLYFHSHCHPAAYCEVMYHNGVVTVNCGVCKSEVVKIFVGSKEEKLRPKEARIEN